MIDENEKICDLACYKNYSINLKALKKCPCSQSQINIFTDGSTKTNDHVGAGFAIYRGNVIISTGSKLMPNAIVFQAEVMAMKIAIQTFNEIILYYCKSLIFRVNFFQKRSLVLNYLLYTCWCYKLVLGLI